MLGSHGRKHIAVIVELSRAAERGWRASQPFSRTLRPVSRSEHRDPNRLSAGRSGAFPGFHGIIEEIPARQRAASRGKKKGLEISGAPSRHFHPPGDRAPRRFEPFRNLPEVPPLRGVSRFMQNGTWLPGELPWLSLRGSTLYPARACEDRGAAGPSAPRLLLFPSPALELPSIGPGRGRGPCVPSDTSHISSSNNLDPAACATTPFLRSDSTPIFRRAEWKPYARTLIVESEGTPAGIRVTIVRSARRASE